MPKNPNFPPPPRRFDLTVVDRMEIEEDFLDVDTATLRLCSTKPPFKKWEIAIKGEQAPQLALLVMRLLQTAKE